MRSIAGAVTNVRYSAGEEVHLPNCFPRCRWWVLAALVACCATGGCDAYYRLNHWHSDANQKLAQNALEQFSSETDRTTGQLATELKNLRALNAFEQVGAGHRIELD